MLPAHFWANVLKTDSCWLWTGRTVRNGYGQFYHDGRTQLVHRLVYDDLVGPVAPDLELDHLCRVRACCNPAHLEAVSHRTNVLRGQHLNPTNGNAQKTHCKHGHAFTAGNTIYLANGRRKCRACHNRIMRAQRAHKRQTNGSSL